MNIPNTVHGQKELLLNIANQLDPDRSFTTLFCDEIPGFLVIEFEFSGSPEGVTIGIQNGEIWFPNCHKNKFHFVINAWPYDQMTGMQLEEMEAFITRALELMPEAVFTIQNDDMDYNPNSALPECNSSEDRHIKTSNPDRWKWFFQVD